MKHFAFIILTFLLFSAYCYDNLDLGVPCPADAILDREGFCIGYDEQKKQPIWCSYRLTKDRVLNPVVKRMLFAADRSINKPVTPDDYTGSGYDRGHIVPAADMAWSTNSMKNSFFMSNMSPQVGMFNRGIWRFLEAWVRETAIREESIFVVTGPIFYTNVEHKVIGKTSSIVVPDAYYKVIYDETPPEKMIGFILKNEPSTNTISSFAVPVAEVERATGMDFFNKIPYDIQTNLEASVTVSDWNL